MADSKDPSPSEQSDTSLGFVARLRAWAGASQKRNLLIGVGFGLACTATVALWLTATEIAVAPEVPTVERALQALDQGDFELARTLIADLPDTDSLSAADYGGALFVLGAIKVNDAERQWSAERSRTDYFVASKYLEEGRSIGFPEDRAAEGLFLLGKSLIESRQLEAGVEVLQRALEAGTGGEARAHLLLAEAYFYAPRPDYLKAINEVSTALKDTGLETDTRAKALLMRAEALAAVGRGADALRSVEAAGDSANPARAALVEGKAWIAELKNAPRDQIGTIAARAEAALKRARRADKLSTAITRQSDYLRAKITELLSARTTGDSDLRASALSQYDALRRSDGVSPAGIAAALAEAAMLQEDRDDTGALDAYRRALDAIPDPKAYRSGLLPLSEVRLKVRAAHAKFLEDNRFDSAIQLLGRVERLIGPTDQMALQADTLHRWGEWQIEAAGSQGNRSRPLLSEGRSHLRAAGLAYERLAEARYATTQFTDDLWNGADSLRRGQGYRDAIRILNRYIRNEPVERNALALLRLGEAHLARGEDDAAISAFEECLEFHADDASSFAARIECAKSYRLKGDVEKAETLLRHNLMRTALTPDSPEWRDSSFMLGQLLAEGDQHDEAIRQLEESISRYERAPYKDDPAVRLQVRSARYRVATAHREAAREPLVRLKIAKTVNDAETARAEADEHLEAALQMFRQVQDEIIKAPSRDQLDLTTQRNCFMLAGDVLFELGRYEDARQSFSNVSTLYQNEPYMLEALVHIYHCWRRQSDRPKARGVIRQAQLLLDRLPPDANFATSTNLSRNEWDRLLTQLDKF